MKTQKYTSLIMPILILFISQVCKVQSAQLEKGPAMQADTKKTSIEASQEKRATVQALKSEDRRLEEPVLRWADEETGQTLFDIDDIVRFDWKKQIFELTRQSAMDLLSKQTKLYRKFTLINGTETIYSGAFVSHLSSIGFPGPAIFFDGGDLNKIKPPLFEIDNGYPEPIAKSEPDPRFSERLKNALERAGVLEEIEPNNPPVPIESITHGWFGEKDGLRALVEVFPETFRPGRGMRIHIHLTNAKYLDENHVVDINAMLVSDDGKSKFSTDKIFTSHGSGWKNIYVLEMNPLEAERDLTGKRVKPGLAKLNVEVFTRKIIDKRSKTYSRPIDHLKTDTINIMIESGRSLLPEQPAAIMAKFQRGLRQKDWEKSLSYCSNKVKAKATEYESTKAFFNNVLPIEEITSLSEFEVSSWRTRNKGVISYGCDVKLKDLNSKYGFDWDLSVCREDSRWVVEFPTKPLDVWKKHEELKCKWANGELKIEPEKIRKGFEISLIPLGKNFTIGKPMLFRLEMKNINKETLGYTHTSFMVNDPMIVKDSNSSDVPYIDTSYQTIGGFEFLEPGETVVLADNYDVRSQYHIVKPGKYTFQFKGLWDTKPSNIVEATVLPGQLSALEGVVENLKPVLPKGWTLTRRLISFEKPEDFQGGEAVSVFLIGKSPRKGSGDEGIDIAILLASGSIPEEYRSRLGGMELWGNCELGLVYVRANNAEQLWPNYKEQIRNALNIQTGNQNPL